MNATMRRLKNRDGEGGFTLIEVMVVVLVIGILLAIGVPTFLGARTRAQDRAAQTSLRTGLTAAMVIYTDSSDITEATKEELTAAEPAVQWIAWNTSSTAPGEVSVLASDASNWYASAMSGSGTCFTIHVDTAGPVDYGQTTDECDATQAASPTSNSW